MTIYAYDFETTGVDPNSCEPVQLAGVRVAIHHDGTFSVQSSMETLLVPMSPIPEGATKVHGITTEQAQAEGADPVTVVTNELQGVVLGYNNHSYDDVIAARYGAKITTSYDIYPAIARLKDQGLLKRASLGAAYEALTGKKAENAHNALADVMMTLALIQPAMTLTGHKDAMEFLKWSSTPQINPSMLMPFGKHKGTKITNLPTGYLNWSLENMNNLQVDLRATMVHILEQRNGSN